MARTRFGTAFLYDSTTGDIVGVRDPDNSELYLVPNVGAFFDTTDQTATADTAKAMTFNTVQIERGVELVANSKIYVDRQATYNVQFSAMFSNPEATAYAISVWLAVNGVATPDSCTDLTVHSKHGSINGKAVAAWNFFLDLNAGDYLEMYWSTPQATVFIEHQHTRTTPARPAIPSVILTVNEINGQRRTS
ncbi:MAG: hypothetical protein ACO25M_00040 [Limnohabitans sp.]|jgi:hypothetical protein